MGRGPLVWCVGVVGEKVGRVRGWMMRWRMEEGEEKEDGKER